MNLKTIKEIPELAGKRVLLRVDFNVPIDDSGQIQDDTRIVESLETIKHLQGKSAKTIIITHLGRPNGQLEEGLKLDHVAKRLSELLNQEVIKSPQVVGPETDNIIENMKDSQVVILENVRFHAGEEENDSHFTKELSQIADIYVNDAFGTAHRAHGSTTGITEHLPSYAGFLIEKEVKALSPILNGNYPKPLTMIFGGAKIDTKIGMIKNFIEKADTFLIGGGLANTFLYAAGYDIGESLFEEDKKETAQEIMLECEKHHEKFLIPQDAVVADEIDEDAKVLDLPVEDIFGDMKILDIGRITTKKYVELIKKSKTVIWNGPLGLYELTPFQNGSKEIAEAIAHNEEITSIIGGGDTLDCIKRFNIPAESFTHISTGGGAAIDFLSGKTLPALKPLFK